MAAVGFDSFDYAKELESAGMPRQLAEVVARGMTNSFVLNFDALVTKDYLDARLDQFRGEFNARFGQIDARFEQIDARFDQMEARFEHQQGLTDARFAQFSAEFNGKLRSIQVTLVVLGLGLSSSIFGASNLGWLLKLALTLLIVSSISSILTQLNYIDAFRVPQLLSGHGYKKIARSTVSSIMLFLAGAITFALYVAFGAVGT